MAKKVAPILLEFGETSINIDALKKALRKEADGASAVYVNTSEAKAYVVFDDPDAPAVIDLKTLVSD